jgi:hypothetical protein
MKRREWITLGILALLLLALLFGAYYAIIMEPVIAEMWGEISPTLTAIMQ